MRYQPKFHSWDSSREIGGTEFTEAEGEQPVFWNPNDRESERSAQPIAPLPSPREGGAAGEENMLAQPITPLPNPGEGGAVGGENMSAQPIAPLPNPGEGGAVSGGNMTDFPVTPLPDNNGGIVFPGTIITIPVRPVAPCFFCDSERTGEVRFLNAAVGYQPFTISIAGKSAVRNLEYAEISEYGKISVGYQTVSVLAPNGYIYLSKNIEVTLNSRMTAAIVNVAGGLDLVVIDDVLCSTPLNGSCIRGCNLSYNSGPLKITLGGRVDIFGEIEFKEVTPYRRILPGRYVFSVFSGNEFLTTTEITTSMNSQYTIYCFNWENSPKAIRTLVIEDRR